jgi:hypothetical protein
VKALDGHARRVADVDETFIGPMILLFSYRWVGEAGFEGPTFGKAVEHARPA